MKQDIRDINDVKVLVDQFCARAGQDTLLGPIFTRLKDADIDKQALYSYWSGELLSTHGSDQEPFPRHLELMFTRRHFIRWSELFLRTIDSLYAGAKAEKAKVTVIRKSEEFQSKLELRGF